MFQTDQLSIIRSLNTVYTATGICHASYVDCLLARSALRSILTCLLARPAWRSILNCLLARSAWRSILTSLAQLAFILTHWGRGHLNCLNARSRVFNNFNSLKAELNPICYLLALLAHHFLHVSRIRVKSVTLRQLMSCIYGAPILDVSRSHTTHHSR